MIVNFAERAHNHNWEVDPVIRSLLDTDFYKLLMLQFIWKHYPKTRVSFALFNRTSSVRLGDMFATRDIAEQLEHVRKLRFRKSELVWLAGNTFYGRRGKSETRPELSRCLHSPRCHLQSQTRRCCRGQRYISVGETRLTATRSGS